MGVKKNGSEFSPMGNTQVIKSDLINQGPKVLMNISISVRPETFRKLSELSERIGIKKYRLVDAAIDLLLEEEKKHGSGIILKYITRKD